MINQPETVATVAALHEEYEAALISNDVEKLTGEMVQKQVDLDLTVAGEPKAYTMMLRKYELSGGSGSRMVSRWVVQDLKPKA